MAERNGTKKPLLTKVLRRVIKEIILRSKRLLNLETNNVSLYLVDENSEWEKEIKRRVKFYMPEAKLEVIYPGDITLSSRKCRN
jgi:hypothetical protein